MQREERVDDELRMEDLGDSAANKSPIEQVSYEFDPATGPTGHYEGKKPKSHRDSYLEWSLEHLFLAIQEPSLPISLTVEEYQLIWCR
jgi:hypothetical protein